MATKQTVTVTFKKLIDYINAAHMVKPQAHTAPKTKLEYAIDRNRSEAQAAFDKYQQKIRDIRTKYANVKAGDKDNPETFHTDKDGNYTFTRDATVSVEKEIDEMGRTEEIELNVYHAVSIPENLSPHIIESLQPISISGDYVIPDESKLPDDLPERAEPSKAK